MVETADLTSPLAIPPGTYTPLETVVSADGVTMDADTETQRTKSTTCSRLRVALNNQQ